MNRPLTWFFLVLILLTMAGANLVHAEASSNFPAPPNGMMLPAKDFPMADPSRLGPPPFIKDDELLKRAFAKHDRKIMKFIMDQIDSHGPEGLKEPKFREELKKKLDDEVAIADKQTKTQLNAKDQELSPKNLRASGLTNGVSGAGTTTSGVEQDGFSTNHPNQENNGRKDGTRAASELSSKSPPSQKPGSIISIAQAKEFIPGFDVKVDNKSGKVEVDGKIPNKCKSDLSIEASESSNTDDVVHFRIIDVTGHGLSCLKNSQGICTSQSNECTALSDAPIIFKKFSTSNCPTCGVPDHSPGAPRDGLSSSGFNDLNKIFEKNEKVIKKIKSMSCSELGKGIIPTKMMAGSGPALGKDQKGPPPMQAPEGFESAIQDAMDEKMNSCKEEMAAKKVEMKKKMLERIKSMPCPKPGDDMDPKMAGLGDFKPPKGGMGHDGPPDMEMDSDFKDEFKDATQSKMKTCMQENGPGRGGPPSMASGGSPFGGGGGSPFGGGGGSPFGGGGGYSLPMMSRPPRMGFGYSGNSGYSGGGYNLMSTPILGTSRMGFGFGFGGAGIFRR